MTSTQESIETKEHRRFKVPKDAFVALRSNYIKLGQIEHVGMDGLEFRYATVNETPFPALPMRQCDVKFGALTPNQRSQLEYFVHNYTTGEK
ncbi:MAG: hypothetical protein JRF64_09755 [Deltaproteobacteria bacterium]|nr:hypothetical protein [Deltaproteobacteria bacterium]